MDFTRWRDRAHLALMVQVKEVLAAAGKSAALGPLDENMEEDDEELDEEDEGDDDGLSALMAKAGL